MSKILFVGTDSAMTAMNVKLLKRNGFDVQCAIGADEALDVIDTQQIIAVIADLEVSSNDKIRFCKTIKQWSASIKLLIISESEEDELPVLTAGADDWIKKPYQMQILYARIKALLR